MPAKEAGYDNEDHIHSSLSDFCSLSLVSYEHSRAFHHAKTIDWHVEYHYHT